MSTDLVNTLGGERGFGENFLDPTILDNASGRIDLTGIFGPEGLRFGGNSHTGLWLSNKGNVTFFEPSLDYTPDPLELFTDIPRIAVFWADVDTTSGEVAPTPGGTSTGSNKVWYDLDPESRTFTATWDDVGYWVDQTNRLNAFQLAIQAVGDDGDFDIVFRYESVDWTTGPASGGTDGLGGTPATVGYTSGDGAFLFELPQSGQQEPLRDLENASNIGVPGTFVLNVRNANAGPGPAPIAGSDEDDTLTGSGGPDSIAGLAGNDTIYGLRGNDTLSGDEDDDLLFGDQGRDSAAGGNGNDTVHGGDGDDTLAGDAGDDALYAEWGQDSAAGGDGNDTVHGSDGDDTLTGDGGDDSLDAGWGQDSAAGGDGNDTLSGWFGNDTLSGGADNDRIVGDDGNDVAEGDTGDDVLLGEFGSDTLSGDDGGDRLEGNADNDSLSGGNGSDRIFGGDGADTVEGGAGADTLRGGAGADRFVYLDLGDGTRDFLGDFERGIDRVDLGAIDADPGQDGHQAFVFIGRAAFTGLTGEVRYTRDVATRTVTVEVNTAGDTTPELSFVIDKAHLLVAEDFVLSAGGSGPPPARGNDTMSGGDGDDRLFGDFGSDSIAGGDGNDSLLGGSGNDTLSGDAGNDRLGGNQGDDSLSGGDGADRVLGGDGADTLRGDAGADTLRGDAGADRFVYLDFGDGTRDFLGDFERGIDRVDLSALDADPGQAGDQAFVFIGRAAFTGLAGEVRFTRDVATRTVTVEVNTAGDTTPELSFVIDKAHLLQAGDFIL